MININLIPSNMWFLNLRKLLSETQWTKLSNEIRSAQNWTCQACRISIKQLKSTKWFDCHEMWNFNDKTQEVELQCLVCLCKKCHTTTHFGYAQVKQKSESSFKHLCKVNHWDSESAALYIEACFEQWSKRSNKKWELNWKSFENCLDEELILTAQKNFNNLILET